MPIDWVTYQKIRYMYISEKKKVRAIARELSMSRKTIRKYCLGAQQPDTRKTYVHTASPIEETAKKEILILLEENKNLPRKQKRNAKDIWEYLQDIKGIPLAQSTIRRYVRILKNEMPEVFIPLEHGPGESMQFDWGDMTVYIENTKTVISLFCIALPHSGAIAGFVYPDKTMPSFIDGHIQAFTFFNGVGKRCVYDYDNLKTAVLKGYGQHAVKQTAFIRIESHYAFESVFCNIASGWD